MKNHTSTKSGPGRVHWSGHKKNRPMPLVPSSFGASWLGQHTNPGRRPRDVPKPSSAKPLKARQREPHTHPLRDSIGVITLVGRDAFGKRRKWLAGISAQRGY